jgi:hypothetical protein
MNTERFLTIITIATATAGFTNLFQTAIRHDGILSSYLPTIIKIAIQLKFIKLLPQEIDNIQNLYNQINTNNKKQIIYQINAYLLEIADTRYPNLLKPLGACYICFNTYLTLITTTILTTLTNLKPYDPLITPLISVIPLQIIYNNKN